VKRLPQSRKPANLSESVLHHLNMYALAAGAAGAGMFALAQPAHAKIIYTPAHRPIGPNQTISLDLNHDGIKDFSFRDTYSTNGNSGGGALNLVPAKSANQVWVKGGYAAALAAGVRIGPARLFAPDSKPMARVFFTPSSTPNTRFYGPWQSATNRYLGLRFLIGGKTHFGWARLTVKAQVRGVVATLTGYAYETIPNTPIIAGKTKGSDDSGIGESHAALAAPNSDPVTLGMLALGSPSLSIWRRKESLRVQQ
jgi:hypothetical protein